MLTKPSLETIITLLTDATPETIGHDATKARQALGKMLDYRDDATAAGVWYSMAHSAIGEYEVAIRTGDATGAQGALFDVKHFATEALAAQRAARH